MSRKHRIMILDIKIRTFIKSSWCRSPIKQLPIKKLSLSISFITMFGVILHLEIVGNKHETLRLQLIYIFN